MLHVGAGLWDGKHGDRWQAMRDSPVRPQQHTCSQAQQDTLRPLFDALKVASVQTVCQLRVLHCGAKLTLPTAACRVFAQQFTRPWQTS